MSKTVLVSCEFSGRVRTAFRRRGHRAWSCDLLPAEDSQRYHLRWDVRDILHWGWDLIIAFPPCTYLARSGARWFASRRREQLQALQFVRDHLRAPGAVAVENPIGVISTFIRPPDQVIHPWQFGHGEAKTMCLWLKHLPPLTPTLVVEGRAPRVHHAPDSRARWKRRSRTYPGVADAMAAQWGPYAA